MLKLTIATVPASNGTALSFLLTNTARETVRFLYWNTPFDPTCPQGLRIASEGLADVVYRGARAKYAFDPNVSLVAIAPGETIERVVAVAEHYRLPAAATYAIDMIARLRGIVGDIPAGLTPSGLQDLSVLHDKALHALTPVDIDESFPLAFASDPDASPPCSTPICWRSYHEPPVHCVLGRARYAHAKIESGSPQDRAIVKAAVDRLFHRIAPRGPYRFAVKDDAHYRRWFGAYSEARAEVVRAAIRGTQGQSVCKSFVIYVIARCAESDTVAVFRKPTSDERYGVLGVCRPFFKGPESGRDSRAGTLAHELSHGYADTADHEYGADDCMRLARLRPDLAVANADSYQYYLEDILLSLKDDEHEAADIAVAAGKPRGDHA